MTELGALTLVLQTLHLDLVGEVETGGVVMERDQGDVLRREQCRGLMAGIFWMASENEKVKECQAHDDETHKMGDAGWQADDDLQSWRESISSS